jgi:hypothetical protein
MKEYYYDPAITDENNFLLFGGLGSAPPNKNLINENQWSNSNSSTPNIIKKLKNLCGKEDNPSEYDRPLELLDYGESNKFRTIPTPLAWYIFHFLDFNTIDINDAKLWFPKHNPENNSYMKVREEGAIHRTVRSVFDRDIMEIDEKATTLSLHHILQHLSHDLLDDHLLQTKYYWIMTNIKQGKTPKYFCLDIDRVCNTKHFHEIDPYEYKKITRTSQQVNGVIKKICDLLEPATPLIFSSSSGSIDKRHMYFLLDDDVVDNYPLENIETAIGNILKPIFYDIGCNWFEKGRIEFFPAVKQKVLAPLGLNSRLYIRDNNTFRLYQRQTKGKRNPPNTPDSLRYLLDLDDNDKIIRISNEQIEEYSKQPRVAQCSSEEKSTPTISSGGGKNIAENKDVKYRHVSDIKMEDGASTAITICDMVVPAIRTMISNGKLEISQSESTLENWINENINNQNSDTGAKAWIETIFNSKRPHKFLEYLHNPIAIKRENRTKELLLYYLHSVRDINLIGQRSGMIKIRYLMFLYSMAKHMNMFGKKVVMDDEIWSVANISKKIITAWGIRGSEHDLINFIKSLRKAKLLMRKHVAIQGIQANEWWLRIPFPLKGGFLDAKKPTTETILHYLTEKELLEILRPRNLSRFKKSVITEMS